MFQHKRDFSVGAASIDINGAEWLNKHGMGQKEEISWIETKKED